MPTKFGALNLPAPKPNRPKAELPNGMTAQELEKGGAKKESGPGFIHMLCITPAQFAALPDGTRLQVLMLQPGMPSSIVVKGQDAISMDARNGVIAYGFEVPGEQAEVASRVGEIAGQTTAGISDRVMSA